MARTRDIDYNAGYTTRQDGTALSNRALYAEEEGKYTEGKFRRMYKVSQRDFAILKSLGFIVSNEWHHTGRSFNRNDFFEWADAEDVEYSEDNLFPENSLAEKYLSVKKEVSALVKDYDKKNWEYQPVFPTRNIPSFEEYKERLINISGGYTPSHLDFFSYLSEEEEARRKAEHKEISLAGYTIGNAFDRALMHKNIDDRYRSLAIKHIGDDKMREEYFHFYKDEIEDNEKIIKQNETARQHNVQSDGKEKVLTRIAGLMGLNTEEAERKTESIFLSVLSKARSDFENTLRNEYDGKVKAVREEIEKKQQDYIKKLLKDGRASRQERVTRQPEYFITEREEMQGRYGWFDASSRYNLPIYYSGISFNDKRSYNHYYKIAQNYSEKIDALREELNKKVANIQYSDIKLHKDVSDEDTSQQKTVSDNESFLRDGLISIMRKAGMEVITDTDAGERVMASLSGNQERQQKVFEGDGTITVTDGVNSSIFYSNALKATLDIRQEKATPEQWLKMLEKNGGLKAGEDKWLGLREWLQSRNEPIVTRREIINFINSNEIDIEEVHYYEEAGQIPHYLDNLEKYNRELQDILTSLELEKEATAKEMEAFGEEMGVKYGYGWLSQLNEQERAFHDAIENRYMSIDDSPATAFVEMTERYGDDFEAAFELRSGELEATRDYSTDDLSDAAKHFLEVYDSGIIDDVRLSYTTEELHNKHEIALTVPAIEPYNESDRIHFGDADGGTAVAWIRFGETPSPDGERVLVIDEIQSKRHQDGREKGYRTNSVEELNRLSTEAENNRHAYSNYENEIIQKYDILKGRALSSDDVVGEILKVASPDEIKKLRDLREAELNSLAAKEEYEKTHGVNRRDLVPAAPFEKNWHELAMKRMLRYAAENGYDKIAWTTGELQAERYSLGKVVDRITVNAPDDNGKRKVALQPVEDSSGHIDMMYFSVDKDGIVYSNSNPDWIERHISDVVGKHLADKIMSVEEFTVFEDNALRIGADGMKGFYDEILPRFIDKYAKKWGVRTEDINLKEVGDTWHSINVTPQMKRDVMQGQPMFFKTANGKAYGFTVNNKIYIDPKIATSETPIHEYSHLWAKAVREGNPEKWDEIKNILLGDKSLSPFINDIRKRYPELESEDDLLDEVLAHYSGKRGAERIRKMAADMAQSSGMADSETWFNYLANKMITAIKRFWKVFADFMHIPYSNKEEIADRIMTDLLSGVNPLTELEKIQANAYKAAQLEIITTANPMTDDYHIGIRSIEDIKTFEEAVLEGEGFDSYPDYTAEDAAEALSSGEITVYSSYPIENGTFVSASRMEAEDYAGGSEIYSKRIPLEDVAWIYASEGQLAKIDRNENLKEWFGKSQVKTEDGTPLAVEHRTNKVFTEFDIAHLGENSLDMGNYGSGFYFGTANRVPSYYGENSMMVYLRISNPYTVERNMPSNHDIYSYLAAKMNEPELRKLIITENGKSISVGEVIDNIKAVDAALSAGNYDAQMATNEELLSYHPRSRRSVFREWKICERIGFIIPASIPYVVKEMIGSEEFSAALKRQGYDGVIAEDASDGNSYREYVAFEPNQVKSATENIGTYRTASRDIRYQYAETLKETSASESKSESENVTETSEVENTKRKLTAEDIEAGGALVDHLRSMGVAVNCDFNGNRKAFKTAKQDKSETGKIRAFVNDKGERYGFSYKGEIYLDSRKIDANLPIHEYAHLWCEAFRKLNSEGWNEVVSLMKSDAESWTAVKDLYPTLDNDSDIAEEVIARYSGKHGEERFISELKRMSPKDEVYSSRWGNIFKNISKAIQDFWKKMGDSIHMRYSSPEEVYDQVIKDFADKVNPRKKVTDYLVSRDKEYMEAVESGNKELSSKIFNEALKENIGNGITPFVSVGGYRGSLQHLAHEVKTGNPAVIERIADMMSPLIPSEAVLIPAPSHKGYATDMLALSEAIAQRTGAEIADVLKSDTRVSQYTAKKETGKAIDADKLGIYAVGEIPNGKLPVIVDNVVDSGNTAEACVRAIGKGIVISLADATKPYAHSSTLRSAAPILRDRNNKVVPLSQRFDMSTGKYLGKTRVFFHKVEDPEEVKIQGLKNYTVNDIKDAVNDYIKALFDGNDIGVENITVIGSRSRNEAKPDSDLDILLEYSNKEWKEDAVFNVLHDKAYHLEIEGIRVDINPINPHYSLSTKEWLARDAKWREEEANKNRDKTILNINDIKTAKTMAYDELKEKAVKLFGKDFEFDFRNEDIPGLKDIERLVFGEMLDTISIDKIIVKDGALSLYSDDLGGGIDFDSLSQNDMERISEKLTELGEYLQPAPKISVPTVSDDEENVSVKDANGVETEYTRIHGWTHDDPALIYANTEIDVYFYDSEKKTVENIDNANGIDSYEDREGFFLVRSDEYSEAYRQLEEHDRIEDEDIEKPYKITIGTDDRHIVPGEYHVEFSKDINAVSYKEIEKLAAEYGGYARIMNNSEWADFYDKTSAVLFADKVAALNDERMKAEAESVRLSGRNENNNLNDKAMKQESKQEELSPIMKQFLDLKSKHPDSLMLFRTGDFYETYQQDAEKASKILGITLTKSTKQKGPDGNAVKMAGFPYHALDTYLPKLIRAGERVAICDQLEAPKQTAKRGISELVSPGAAADNKETQAKASKQDVSDGAVQKEEMKIIEPEKEDKKNILSANVFRDSGSKKYNLTVTFEEDGEKKRVVFTPTAEDLDKFFSEAKGKSKEVVDSIKIALAEKYMSAAQNDEQKVSSKTISSKTSEEKYSEKFAEMMIERIEQCQSNWKTPWLAPMSRPVSMSGRPYNGANWFFLMMHTMEKQYNVPVYGTFKNFTDLNYNKDSKGKVTQVTDENGKPLPKVTILKDEHSVPVNFHSVKVENNETGEKISYKEYKELSKEEQEKYSIKSYDGWHPVFNIDQTNLKEARPELYNKLVEQFSAPKVQKGSEMSMPSLDVMVENNLWLCPIKPTYGNDAYYSISKDEIVVPEKRQFEHDEMYYGNMLHEMTHSTGAEGRLNRLKPSSFGSKEYAKEELVAEMTAAMIASQHGMTKYVKEDSVAYLKSWLESLKQEPSFITSVIKDIDKASTMVNRRIEEVEKERVKGIAADYSAILEENEQLASKTKVNVMPSIPTPAPTEESVTEEENINVDEVEEQGRGRSL